MCPQEDLGRALAEQIRASKAELLAREAELRRARKALAAERRELRQELDRERSRLHSQGQREHSAGPGGSAPAAEAEAAPELGGLSLCAADAAWLAGALGLTAAGREAARAEVALDLDALWPSLLAALPAPTWGTTPRQHFGLVLPASPGSPPRLALAELCPDVFTWPACAAAEGLSSALAAYIDGTLLPWALSRAGAALLVCNDGDAYAIPAPLLRAAARRAAAEPGASALWNFVVVVDAAKSSQEEPALEVFDVTGQPPRRVVFEILPPPSDSRRP